MLEFKSRRLRHSSKSTVPSERFFISCKGILAFLCAYMREIPKLISFLVKELFWAFCSKIVVYSQNQKILGKNKLFCVNVEDFGRIVFLDFALNKYLIIVTHAKYIVQKSQDCHACSKRFQNRILSKQDKFACFCMLFLCPHAPHWRPVKSACD